ncbi:hypothetical protein E7681_10220 [Thalassobius vesicularis]|uniref:DUF2946 domain-containing protein n=1 Tax=Thalassobius vesicularis TaxID=1294297 RepID=A0A4S3M8S1_9RHOB|nr:hypothetical protein [Thalassobius vesicularis]THD73973.1 hypothetical protein E7681_10220 [Thalassobius vesicularis]
MRAALIILLVGLLAVFSVSGAGMVRAEVAGHNMSMSQHDGCPDCVDLADDHSMPCQQCALCLPATLAVLVDGEFGQVTAPFRYPQMADAVLRAPPLALDLPPPRIRFSTV